MTSSQADNPLLGFSAEDDASLEGLERLDNNLSDDDVTCRDVRLTATCLLCNVSSVGVRRCCESNEVFKICHSALEKRRSQLRKKARNPFLGKRSEENSAVDNNEDDDFTEDSSRQDALVLEEDKRGGKVILFGKRGKNPFLGKRAKNPFLGKRAKNPFLGKRAKNPFLGKRAKNPFLGKKSARNPFLGKRKNPFLGKRDGGSADDWVNDFRAQEQLNGLDGNSELETDYE